MVQNELMMHTVRTLAEGGHPSPDRGDMLTDAQIDALDEGGVDLSAAGCQHLLERFQRAAHDPVVRFMTVLLVLLGCIPRKSIAGPPFLSKRTSPRFSGELPMDITTGNQRFYTFRDCA
jgi:hypothetical protein